MYSSCRTKRGGYAMKYFFIFLLGVLVGIASNRGLIINLTLRKNIENEEE